MKKPNEAGYDARRDKYYSGSVRGATFSDEHVPSGLGSASTLYFTPGENGRCTNHAGHAIIIDVEVTLAHELVHSLRMTQGQVSAIPTIEHEFRNEEEFLAIEVENVYRSARDGKKATLRHSHIDDLPDSEWTTAKDLVDEPDIYDVLKYHTEWVVFKELAKMKDIIFNPFYEFDQRVKAKAKAKATTNKPAAVPGRK